MPKKRELTTLERERILTLHEESRTHVEIAAVMGVSKGCISKTLGRFKETGSHNTRKRTGQPRKTTNREDRKIICISLANRRLHAAQIRSIYNENAKTSVSTALIKKKLNKNGLVGRVAARKPLLRQQNVAKRLAWAKYHKDWTITQWKKVLWSDESKFEIFGGHRRVFVRRYDGERFHKKCIVPTVKHGGGSVMVWGCFGGDKVGDLIKIEGIMDQKAYHNIIQRHVLPSGKKIYRGGYTFMQDNDPKHTSKLNKNYLKTLEERKELKMMDWPPQSPDLNPIELLWEELDRRVRELQPTSAADLWKILQECWENITPETLMKLVKRMPRLCRAVIKNRGYFFNEKNV